MRQHGEECSTDSLVVFLPVDVNDTPRTPKGAPGRGNRQTGYWPSLPRTADNIESESCRRILTRRGQGLTISTVIEVQPCGTR